MLPHSLACFPCLPALPIAPYLLLYYYSLPCIFAFLIVGMFLFLVLPPTLVPPFALNCLVTPIIFQQCVPRLPQPS